MRKGVVTKVISPLRLLVIYPSTVESNIHFTMNVIER